MSNDQQRNPGAIDPSRDMTSPDALGNDADGSRLPVPSSPRRTGRRRLLWATSFIAVFLIGAATGGLVTGVMLVRMTQRLIAEPERWNDIVVNRLDRRLDLTPEQEGEVRTIVEERLGRLREIRAQTYPRISVELRVMRAEVAAVLDDAQRATFEAYYADIERTLRMPPPADVDAAGP